MKQETIEIINEIQNKESFQYNSQKQDESPKFCDLFSNRQLINYTILLVIISIGSNVGIYGIQFALGEIGSDFAQNSLYVGIADMIGYTLANFMGGSFKRKKVSMMTFIIASFICIFFVFIEEKEDGFLCHYQQQKIKNLKSNSDYGQEDISYENQDQSSFIQNQDQLVCYYQNVQLGLIMLCRLFISIFTSFLAIWRTELYPIKVRSNGIGFVGALGLIGAQIFPVFEFFSEQFGIQIIVLIGIFCMASAIPGFFLKETFIQKKQKNPQSDNQDFTYELHNGEDDHHDITYFEQQQNEDLDEKQNIKIQYKQENNRKKVDNQQNQNKKIQLANMNQNKANKNQNLQVFQKSKTQIFNNLGNSDLQQNQKYNKTRSFGQIEDYSKGENQHQILNEEHHFLKENMISSVEIHV